MHVLAMTLETSKDGSVMQGRDAGSQRDNWDKPAKGENPDRKT